MVEMFGFDGEKIDQDEWSQLMRGEDRVVGRSLVSQGGHEILISTVWIGLAWLLEAEEGEKPLIYETMVFYNGSYDDLWSRRDATREDAKKTHDWIVDEIVSGRMVLPGPEYSDDEVF